MLRVDLRAVERGPVEVAGTVAADDPVLADTGLRLCGPIRVGGRMTAAGVGQFFWRGQCSVSLEMSCRRCLSTVRRTVAVPIEVLLTDRDDADDPSAYPLPDRAEILDLRPMVREEVLVAVPPFILCRDDCRGLCDGCGVDLNRGSCECTPVPDGRWAALEALKAELEGREG